MQRISIDRETMVRCRMIVALCTTHPMQWVKFNDAYTLSYADQAAVCSCVKWLATGIDITIQFRDDSIYFCWVVG